MKTLILLGAVGLVVGIGGGTGLSFVLAPAASADSTADSTAMHETPPDDSVTVLQAPPEAVKADSQAPPHGTPADSAHASVATVAEAHGDAPAPPNVPSVVSTPDSAKRDSLERTQLRRISRIFAAMAPREAAKVLQQLEDPDVISIVGSLTEKQAAAVLTAMPPERAATISRGSMRKARTP